MRHNALIQVKSLAPPLARPSVQADAGAWSGLGRRPPPRPLTLAKHEAAFGLAGRHGFPLHHALIVAAALEAGCATLFPEEARRPRAG